jgi:hypothetical protein
LSAVTSLFALSMVLLVGAHWAKQGEHAALQYFLVCAAILAFLAMVVLRRRREEDAWAAAARTVAGTVVRYPIHDLPTRFGDAPWSEWPQLTCTNLIQGQRHRPPFWLLEIEYAESGGEGWLYYRMTFAVVGLANDWSTSLRPLEQGRDRVSAENGRFLFMWSPQRWLKGRHLKTHELPDLLADARAVAKALDAQRRTAAAISSKPLAEN